MFFKNIFHQCYPNIKINLNLSDKEPDLIKENIDISILQLSVIENQEAFFKKL